MKHFEISQRVLFLAMVSGCAGMGALTAQPAAAEDAAPAGAEECLTQLQLFLDSANFGPGKIDGRWGEFTRKALSRYLSAQGKAVPASLETAEGAPAEFGVDASGVRPVFMEYTVSEEDLAGLGDIPEDDYAAQEKLESMPYERLTELVAERFHADEDYLQELNPNVEWAAAEAGLKLKVPNVARPFYVKEVKSPAEVKSEKTDGTSTDAEAEAGANDKPEVKPAKKLILVDTAAKMLEVREGEKLTAAFPITPGSDATPAPVGKWTIKGVAYMPDFRRDESMLKTGVRSEKAHLIPPGPNNAVGVVWIALSKDGIGIHGTHDPDTIGRNASHGCIRLANWDIVELAKLVEYGMDVTIR